VHPFAGTLAKQWDFNKFQSLINTLTSQGFLVIVVGVKSDTHNLEKIVDARGEFSLAELAFLIKQAGFFIGLDSGPAHIAIATRTKSVIICSGTNKPEAWIPQAPFVRLVYHDVECKPCGLTVCLKDKHYCMEAITVEEVMKLIS
jgi:heptosyltransferase-3